MSGLLNILTESVNEVPRIEFPNLFDKSIIVNRVAFNLFGIDIYWYGVIIAVGVILAFIYAMHKCKQFGLIPDHVFDVAFVAIIFGFIGARAYYCIFIDTDINFFDLRHGGLAIYGGIIAAAIAAAGSSLRRKLLNGFIESVVIIEKVLCLGRLVFEHRLSARAGHVQYFRVDIRGCRNHSVGIFHNEAAEVFV